MNIAGAVILYNPDDCIIENINSYLPILKKLYIVDNSTKPCEFLDKIKSIKKVEYISMDGNKGIAKALRVATEQAIEDGFEYILSMDQDSKFPTGDFDIIKDYISNNDLSNIGVICINYTNSNIKKISNDKTLTINVDDTISSGSIVVLKNYAQINGYNEELFIDYVDNDLCYQFREKGFEIVLFPNIFLDHKLGNVKHVKFLWYNKDIVMHSPLRYYYMYRNYTYLLNHRSEEYVKFLKTKAIDYSFKFKLRRVLLEKPHFKIAKMIRLGIKHGKKGILGPYQQRSNK